MMQKQKNIKLPKNYSRYLKNELGVQKDSPGSFNDIEELPRVHILEENWNVEDVSEEELRKRCNDILKRLEWVNFFC